jgi:nucleoside-diphosphate-sugar epimerase
MRVFVAGATGAIGRQLVPRLVANGHDVVGMTRSLTKRGSIAAAGATPVVADALDPEQVARAVGESEPDVIVHELTALSESIDLRHMERDFALTNRLRTEALDHLLAAGRAVGTRRFVAQSYGSWTLPPGTDPPASMRPMLEAARYLEETVTNAAWVEGVVLRYGSFYGPGTSLDGEDSEHARLIRARKFPIVGGGGGVWSFIHVEDAADATVAAVERGKPGIYNVVDDDPVAVAEWLPVAAEAFGAKPPRRVPRWVGRLLAGEPAAIMMTEVHGASNAEAKRELGWQPSHPSLRESFRRAAA